MLEIQPAGLLTASPIYSPNQQKWLLSAADFIGEVRTLQRT